MDEMHKCPEDIVRLAEEEGREPLDLLGELADKELEAEDAPHEIGMTYLSCRLSCDPKFERTGWLERDIKGNQRGLDTSDEYTLSPYHFELQARVACIPSDNKQAPLWFAFFQGEGEPPNTSIYSHHEHYSSFVDLADAIDKQLHTIAQRVCQKTRDEP